MVTYRVTIAEEAQAELKGIYLYLKTNESEAVANKVRDGLLEAIDKLANMPHRHGPAQEIQHETIIFRRILKWSYKIIFVVEEDEVLVRVVAVVHSRQNPQRLQDRFGGE